MIFTGLNRWVNTYRHCLQLPIPRLIWNFLSPFPDNFPRYHRYLGNYYYNIQNKNAANASGGSDFAMTISTAQLAIGVIYAVFLWIAPDARKPPSITVSDFFKMIPAGICSAGAHAASVFALAAGGVAFGQIVKAAEPAFAAVIGTFVYGKKISMYKWMCLIPIIGGVCLAALKQVIITLNPDFQDSEPHNRRFDEILFTHFLGLSQD